MDWTNFLKGVIGKILLTGIFLGSTSMFFLLYPLISDPDYYKNLILESIYNSTSLEINYSSSEPIFFPFPGMEFNNVTVSKEKDELITLQSIKIEIYYGIFFGQSLQLRKVYLHSGTIEVNRELDESFPILEKLISKKETSDPTTSPILFSELFQNLASGIEIKNITILFDDKLLSRKMKIYLWEANLDVDRDLHDLDFFIYGKLNDDPIQISATTLFTKDEINFENLRIEGELNINDLHGNDLKDILVIFPNGDFRFARANGKIYFFKRNDLNISAIVEKLHIRDLAIKNDSPFGNAHVSVNITYDLLEKKISFNDILIDWKGSARVYGSGFVNFIPPPLSPTISFEVRSDFIDLELAKKVVKIWIDPDLERSLLTRNMESTGYGNRMNVYLNLDLKNAKIKNLKFDRLTSNIHYSKSNVRIKKLNLLAYEGYVQSKGLLTFGNSYVLTLDGNIQNLDISTFLMAQFQSAPIAGKLSSDFELSSFGNSESELLKNISSKGNITATNGQLLSFTNILKPISSIGSIINLKKFDFNRATPYNTINFGYEYNNEIIEIQNFTLKADGITGAGAGKINLNKKIDMKFTIALPGIAGKALKLPIIYKGNYGSTAPYIDPIWLGSVYVGTILLANPAGAAVGGIAGSAMSDYVNKAVDTVSSSVDSSWKAVKSGWKSVFNSEEVPEAGKGE